MTSTLHPNTITLNASDHVVNSVKVSKSRNAEVVRSFELSLKKGQNSLSVTGLSSVIKYIRPSIPPGAAARVDDFLFTVDRAPVPVLPPVPAAETTTSEYGSPATPESLRTLLLKEAALQSLRQLKENEAQLLSRYAQTLSGDNLAPGEVGAFLKGYAEEGARVVKEITSMNEELVALQRETDAERARLALKAGETHGRVAAVITAERDTEITFGLTYIVGSCSWRPVYELHATTESSGRPSTNIALHYFALVSQSTGEDWARAELTLSTVASELGRRRLPRWPALKVKPAVNTFGGGLFGQPQPGNNLFGQVHQQQKVQQQQQQQQAQRPLGGALFGATTATAPTPSVLFGGGGGGTSTFGAQPPPSSNHFSGEQRTDPPGLLASAADQILPGASGEPLVDDDYDDVGADVGDHFRAAAGGDHENGTGDRVGEPASVVRETPLSMAFAIAGGASCVPSDGLAHQVSLAVVPLSSTISCVTSPRDDANVFLQCEVKNTSEYRLLAGPMSIIVDGSYVSSTTIDDDINPSDTLACVLGPSLHTKVTYTRTAAPLAASTSAFAEATDATLHTATVLVHNTHPFTLERLVVKERLPTCDDRRVSIVLRRPKVLAGMKDGAMPAAVGDISKEGKDDKASITEAGQTVHWEPLVRGRGGEKEGRFEWLAQVESGASVEFRLEYEVRVPRGAGWVVLAENGLFRV